MKTITIIICFLSVLVATAQWTTDTEVNTLVAESGELDMQAKGTSDGQTFVVYWKNVGAPTFIELRLQIMDAEGNRKFGNDGMLVSDQLPMSSSTVIMSTVVDADDKLYIGVTGTGGGDPAFVFKMDLEGNQLWGANGVNVGSGNVVTVLPLSGGGAIVSWLGSSGAVMQKYDESGEAVWPTTKTIELAGSTTSPANLFEISDGNYIVVFHKLLSGINSFLYAQRYDPDGNPVWTNPTQISDSATAFIRSYTGVQDGDVVYMGYFASAGTRFDSYLQRINPDGTLPWGINGSDFDVNQTNYEMEAEAAFTPDSDFIWMLCRYTDNTQSLNGEYVQKFDKSSGARLLTDNAKVVFPIGSEKVLAGNLQLMDDSPLFLMKEGMDNGVSPVTLNAVYLDENGDFFWPEETQPIATFPANKSRIQFTQQANSQSVAVFIEDKGDGQKIYAQNLADEVIGIEEISSINVFFENPVKNEMYISSDSSIRAISIYNVLGKRVLNLKNIEGNSININTESWTSGVYFLNISTNKGMKKGVKLLKQ